MQLGVERDRYGKPIAFYFGNNGSLTQLNWSNYSYGSPGARTRRVPAAAACCISGTAPAR